MTLFSRAASSYVAMTVLAVLSACTSTPSPAPPTVGAVATAAASPVATIAAAASPAAATAVAAASPVAATVAAGASPAATAAASVASPAAATVVAASPVRLTGVQVSSNDVALTAQNTGSAAVDLAGWRLRAGAATATLPSGARAAPGESVILHTAAGTSTARDVYLGQEASSLVQELRPGATVALIDAQGNSVSEFRIPG